MEYQVSFCTKIWYLHKWKGHGCYGYFKMFATKSSYGKIFFISHLELGDKVLTPKMKKIGEVTNFQGKMP